MVANCERAKERGDWEEVAKEMEEKERPEGVKTSGTLEIEVTEGEQVMIEEREAAASWTSAGRVVLPMRKQGCCC